MSAVFYPHQKISFNGFILCSTLVLTACGGGGDSGASAPVANTPPSNVAFTGVTSSTTELNVSWQTASDDKTPVAQLEYTLHLLEGNADFTPSTSTQKFKAKNSTSTQIMGLKAQTTYQLKLVVTDGDGLSTTSPVFSFTTDSLPNAAPSQVAINLPLKSTAFTITATWGKATDDNTPQAELNYSLHWVEGKSDFVPSADNQYVAGANITTAALTGLKSNTDYAFKVVVKDKQGLSTASSLFTAKTLVLSATSIGKLNDTGILACANDNTWFSDCSKSNLGGLWGLNQDGEVGRDYLFATQQISKVGGGVGGGDFTKIDATGNKVAANAASWSCVQDNVTGLMWEVKTTSGTHDKNKTYTWYHTDSSTNGGDMGVIKEGSSHTLEFINTVNAEGWCGHKDWRLPTRQELDSIIHYGSTLSFKIDTVYFPHTQAFSYWTATPMASSKFSAWAINFADGTDVADVFKGLENYVRLVRTVTP